MDLNILWFILIAVLFAGFFFLEGFDYGVGILLQKEGKNDTQDARISVSLSGSELISAGDLCGNISALH